MDNLRALIYRLGFKPKPGNIFFSPSRDFTHGVKFAVDYFKNRNLRDN